MAVVDVPCAAFGLAPKLGGSFVLLTWLGPAIFFLVAWLLAMVAVSFEPASLTTTAATIIIVIIMVTTTFLCRPAGLPVARLAAVVAHPLENCTHLNLVVVVFLVVFCGALRDSPLD